MMGETFLAVAAYCGAASTIFTLLILLIKPLRGKFLGIKKIAEGQKCILRSDMTRIYYSCQKTGEIRQYQFENFSLLYAAYKKLGGNSFIDKIWAEIQTYKIIS